MEVTICRVWRELSQKRIRIEVGKVPAHKSLKHAVAEVWVYEWWGNGRVDNLAKMAAADYATSRGNIAESLVKGRGAEDLLLLAAKVACRFQEKMEKQDVTWVRKQAKKKAGGQQHDWEWDANQAKHRCTNCLKAT